MFKQARTKRILISLAPGLIMLSFFAGESPLWGQELRYVTPSQVPFFDVLPQVAEERGLWKEGGVSARWIRFRGGVDMYRALLAGHADMGTASVAGTIQVNSRLATPGLIMVADTGGRQLFMFWVRTDSPIKVPEDLKGKKIGLIGLGTIFHAYAQVAVRALGIEKDVKFLSVGGVAERLAAMKAGVIDVTVGTFEATIDLKYKGVVREFLDTTPFLPKEWIDRALFVPPAFAEKNPEVVKRGIKALLAAADYLQGNPRWIGEYVKREYGYSALAAEAVQRDLVRYPNKDKGRIDRKAVENAANFLAEYGFAPKEKMPVDKQFTNDFVE